MAPAWFSSSSGVSTCSATWQVSVSLYSSGKSFSPAQTWQKGSSSSRSLTLRTRFFMYGVLLWICIVRSLNGSNHVVGTNASTVNGMVGEITCWQLACLPWTFVGPLVLSMKSEQVVTEMVLAPRQWFRLALRCLPDCPQLVLCDVFQRANPIQSGIEVVSKLETCLAGHCRRDAHI